MKLFPTLAAWLLLVSLAHSATVTFIQTAVNDADGTTIGALSSTQSLATGVSVSTVTAPPTFSNYRFTHWTNSSYPAVSFRDAWGRSINPTPFLLLEATTATAHYLPETRDTDADGVPDWFEIEYYGNLAQSASSDTDADGASLLAELSANTHPLYAESTTEGGIAWADSPTIVVNLAGFATATLRSEPAGTLNQTAVNPPGTVITTPDYSGNPSFGYWKLDGLRQQDDWGVALTQISFTMATANREAVAYFFVGDSDADGVPDAFEQFYYNTLANHAASDTDADGVSLLAEYLANTNPLYAESSTEGGIAWADSSTVVVDLQPILTAPLSNAPANNPVTVAFTLLRTAQAGSVTLTFDDGVTLRPLTLAASQATSGAHTFTFDPANPTATAAIASGSAIPSGTYLVTLSYLDIQLNTVLDASRVGVFIAGNELTYYAAWSAAHEVTGPDSGPDGDFDHDGMKNLLELAFGTNPTVASAVVIALNGAAITQRGAPTMWLQNITNGVDRRALFGRRKDYLTAGLVYEVEFSGDLVTWQTSAAIPAVIGGDSEMDAVTVPYPLFVNGRKARFFRVQVTGP